MSSSLALTILLSSLYGFGGFDGGALRLDALVPPEIDRGEDSREHQVKEDGAQGEFHIGEVGLGDGQRDSRVPGNGGEGQNGAVGRLGSAEQVSDENSDQDETPEADDRPVSDQG